MSENDGGKPPAAWLEHLREAKHWDRLIAMAGKSLEMDPNDPVTHRQIAWAYAASDRPGKMWPHVEFLLAREPDEASSHHLVAVYYLDTGRHKQSWSHIETLLQKNPQSAIYHYLACLYALRVNKMPLAQHHIAEARALAPNWVPAAHLEIRMDAVRRRKASDAWDRIRRLEKTLSLDPQDPSVMSTIGDIYLTELERPRDAERFFRQALCVEPQNKERQAHLLEAIRARSLLYRTLLLPFRAGRWAIADFRRRPLRLLLLFAVFHWLAFAAWVILMGAVFTPCAKMYEWLVLMDVTHVTRLPRWLAPLAPTLRRPLWLRIFICFTLIVGLWLAILHWLFQLRLANALVVLSVIFGIHFGFVALTVSGRKLRARFGKWQDLRRQRREARLTATTDTA